jgi:hypothetical protein
MPEEGKNTGFITVEPKLGDFVAGPETGILDVQVLASSDWPPFLPTNASQLMKDSKGISHGDKNTCVSFGACQTEGVFGGDSGDYFVLLLLLRGINTGGEQFAGIVTLGLATASEISGNVRDILVTACGRICMHRKKINISTVLAGQKLGIKEIDDGIWLVSFMHYDLGYIDLEQRTLQTIDNPFGTRLSPMS